MGLKTGKTLHQPKKVGGVKKTGDSEAGGGVRGRGGGEEGINWGFWGRGGFGLGPYECKLWHGSRYKKRKRQKRKNHWGEWEI